jgi:hypothetical protein
MPPPLTQAQIAKAYQADLAQPTAPTPAAAPAAAPSAAPPTPYREAPGGGTGDLLNKVSKVTGIPEFVLKLVPQESIDRMSKMYSDWQQSNTGAAGAAANVGQAQGEAGEMQARGLGEEANAAASAGAGQSGRADDMKSRAERDFATADRMFGELAKYKTDPDRLFNNASTGQRITWTIAKVLGGAAQGLLHLPTNQAVDTIQKMVDRDVEAQKFDFEAKKGLTDSLYARAFKEYGNSSDATEAATRYGLMAAAKKTEALGALGGSRVNAARANAMSADLLVRGHEIGIQGEKQWQSEHKYIPAQGGGTVDILHDPRVTAMSQQLQKEAAANGQPIEPDEATKRAAETIFPGSQRGGFSSIQKTPNGGAAAVKGAQAQANVDEALRSARELLKEVNKGGELSPARTADLDTRVKELASKLRAADAASGARPAPIDHYLDMLPSNPNGWNPSGSNSAILNRVVKDLEGRKSGSAQALGDVGFQPHEEEGD